MVGILGTRIPSVDFLGGGYVGWYLDVLWREGASRVDILCTCLHVSSPDNSSSGGQSDAVSVCAKRRGCHTSSLVR